ncbi:MAG: hypothetical protein GTN99_08395 [Candidatus Dadabacteria bacterium]|nr:hypothetical protein [Candidatus Dadabacteria bacterium]
MTKYFCMILAPIIILGGLLPVHGSEFIVYPSKNQSDEQMEKDKFQCYTWAKNQTGFDPMQPATTTTAPPQQGAPQGGVVRGGARGALVGTAAGAIAGDTGKGAAIGAASGALVGGMRRRDQRRQEQQAQQDWANREIANYEARRNEYNRAYIACLEGRGYSVR